MEERKLRNDKTAYVLRIALIAVMAVFMCSLAYNNLAIWDDELFTLTAIDGTFGQLWDTVVADLVHPPLHYFLLKLSADLFSADHSGTVIAGKLFSVFWVVLLMVLGSGILAKRYGEKTALTFVLLLSGNMVVGYSVEIRMYSMALSATALAYLYANELIHAPGRKNWLALTFWTVIGIYTNYFAAFALVFLWLALFGWCGKEKHVRAWFLYAIAAIVLYLPWVITVLAHYGNITDYSTALSAKRIIQLFAFPFSCHNDPLSAVLILVTLVLILRIGYTSRKPEFFWVFILNPLWIGLICILSSVLFHKFITGRYLLPGWGAFWAGIAIGTSKLKDRWILPALAVIDLLTCVSMYRVEANDRKAMDDLLAFTRNEQPILAETDVYRLIHYLDPDLAVIENNDPNAGKQRLVYSGSELYFLMPDREITVSFPLAVQEICVFPY